MSQKTGSMRSVSSAKVRRPHRLLWPGAGLLLLLLAGLAGCATNQSEPSSSSSVAPPGAAVNKIERGTGGPQVTTSAPREATVELPLGGELLGQAAGQARQTAGALAQQSNALLGVANAQLASSGMPVAGQLSPESGQALGDFASKLPELLKPASVLGNGSSEADESGPIDGLLPKGTSLFNRDSVDASQLVEIDCHMRNLDYCMAGLMSSAQKMLPETDSEFETRCDEMRAASSCMAVYNKRCSTFKIFALLAPFSQAAGGPGTGSMSELAERQSKLMGQLGNELRLAPQLESQLLNKRTSATNSTSGGRVTVANLMQLCEPSARNLPANRELRQSLFELSKCTNQRMPKLNACLEDLKAAAQIFYEPRRVLPMKPTCCAIARFRACASEALDRVCGLSSFEQLLESMGSTGGSGGSSASPLGLLKTIDRVCRQATDHKSAYCQEVLPPIGMRTPHRRGSKASKLAKALDLFSMAPAVQEPGAL